MSCSDADFRGEANYKDAYLPWRPRKEDNSYTDIEEFVCHCVARPRLCTWIFITSDDAVYLKERQRDKRAILSFLGRVFSEGVAPIESDGFFAKMTWKIFKILRDESFSERGISAALGILYMTHIFFLSSPNNSPEDVYKFFYNSVFMHTVLDPPDCDEVFTPAECELLFELFRDAYLQNVRLLHLINFPDYYRTIEVPATPSIAEESKPVEVRAKVTKKKKK